MKTTVKVTLDDDRSLGYGWLVHCCGKFQQVHVDEIRSGEWWECVECEKPLLLATDQGIFKVGDNVTI